MLPGAGFPPPFQYAPASCNFTQPRQALGGDALRGDGIPSWTKVWSLIQLGEIFDATSQRDRAVREYQLAVQTEDNTRGALDKARELLQKPFEWPETH